MLIYDKSGRELRQRILLSFFVVEILTIQESIVELNFQMVISLQQRWQPKNFGPQANIFCPRPFIVESLKEALDRQSLINKQYFTIVNCTSSWTFDVQSFT